MNDSRSALAVPWRALTMVGALLAIWIIFSIGTGGIFLSPRNLSILMRQMAVTGILASGMVLVIVAGQIDLSVGGMTGFLGALSAFLFVNHHWPLWASFAAAILAGALFGRAQGHLVTRLGLPSFIVTLGGMLIFQGSLLALTGGVAISPTPDYLAVGQAFLPQSLGWALTLALDCFFLWRAWKGRSSIRWKWLGLAVLATVFTAVLSDYQGIPFPVLLLLIVTAALSVLAAQTPFGRHLYAIGGNRDAAFYSGIPIERRLVWAFTLMGALAGVAGVVLTARVGAATSDAGHMMELDAIAAAVIGGTSLMGGRGTVGGALLGALVMASLDNGMGLMNTEAFWQPILKGSILILAVAADMAGRRKN